jgi:oligoendopeptidase F
MTTTVSGQVLARKEISTEDKWNVDALFSSLGEWEKEFAKVCPNASSPHWPELQKQRGKLHESPSVLKEVLDTFFDLSRKLDTLYTYAHLRHDEEISLDIHKQAFQKISSLLHDLQQESAWIESEILELPKTLVEGYLSSPLLIPYTIYLERIVRMQPHTLPADKEELMAMAGKPLHSLPKVFSALNNADLRLGKVRDQTGKEHELSHGFYQLYLRSTDRTLRENAFKTMQGRYLDFENTFAELLYGEVQSHIFSARAHNYTTSVEAALFPKNIPISTYTSLIQAVREGLPLFHRYIGMRKRLLQLSELHLYDMYAPLVPHVDIHLSYVDAEDAVIESVEILGKEYQETLRQGLKTQRWVDRYENKHKRSGAYSSGCFDSYPYILMNYKEILSDAFTLAHEAGHSMHSYLSNHSQPYQYSRYPIFVAEVASTFNEELLRRLLMKQATEVDQKIFLINEKIEDIWRTLFRQTMFAEFELTIHEMAEANIPLTPSLLKETYSQLCATYFGPDITIDPEVAIEWARIPHFYYNFYVYQYATGISAALTLAEKVMDGDTQARDRYLTFLQSGNALYPIELLKLAGVDMSTPEPVRATLQTFDQLLRELNNLA